MSETKLLPCPFCGGQLRRNMCGSFEDDNKGCILYGFEIHEKMIPIWNTRKPMERIVERLEGIEESIYLERDSIGEEIYKDRDTLKHARNLALQELAFEKAIEIVKEEGLK